MFITSWSSLIFVGFLFTAKASKGKKKTTFEIKLNNTCNCNGFYMDFITENIKYIYQRLSIDLLIYLSIYLQ